VRKFGLIAAVAMTVSLVTPAKVTAPMKLPAVDLSATPTGWVPVADGDVQISVPATWWVLYNAGCPTGSPPGEVLVNPVPEFCPGEIAGEGPKNLVWLTLLAGLGSDYKHRSVINGFSVYEDTPVTYFVPSLRLRVTLSGPLAQRVLRTLSRAPRDVALASGPAPSVPSSWRSVAFAGLRFSVPAGWRTYRWVDVGICSSNDPTLGGDMVSLTNGTHLSTACQQPVELPIVRQPGNGVQVDVDPSPLLVTGTFSTNCLSLHGLIVCPATSPAYSILVLKVTVPGRSKPVYVSIGQRARGGIMRVVR
jgi:hypothetical protein